MDSALNNLWLICYRTKQNEATNIISGRLQKHLELGYFPQTNRDISNRTSPNKDNVSSWLASQALMTVPSVYHPSFAPTVRAIKYSTRFMCIGYDIKQSDGEAPLMLELYGKQSTPSLPSLPDSNLTRSDSTR